MQYGIRVQNITSTGTKDNTLTILLSLFPRKSTSKLKVNLHLLNSKKVVRVVPYLGIIVEFEFA